VILFISIAGLLVLGYFSRFFDPLFDSVWCLYFTLQLVGGLKIYGLPIPANVEFFFSKLLSLLHLSWLSLDGLLLSATNGQTTL